LLQGQVTQTVGLLGERRNAAPLFFQETHMKRIRQDPLFPNEYVQYEDSNVPDPNVASLIVPMIFSLILFGLSGYFFTKATIPVTIGAGVIGYMVSNRVIESFCRFILLIMLVISFVAFAYWIY
jgi:hypothetical protein